ncbi:MAG: sigma-70 family RNA polymerase sigma factor [Paraclostridium sp.]
MTYSEIESLVAKAKTKDEIAINELIKYFTPFIKNFSRKILVNGLSYEDIEQDCYLEIINIINRYDVTKKAFLGFFHKALRNNILGKYRKQLNTKQIELHEETLIDIEENNEFSYIDNFMMIDINNAMDKLSPLERDVIIKYYFEGMTLKDQAKLYNKSYITLVKRKESAIRKLKANLVNLTCYM